MIVEHVLLPVAAERRADFLEAFEKARHFIEPSPGFRALSLHTPVEAGGPMLLLVTWDSVGHHQEGFRQSDRYQAWKALLHPFYPTMPDVRYFSEAV